MSGGGSFSSDQTTLNLATIGAATLARAGRARITSIQAKGIASSTLLLYNVATSGAAAAGNLVARSEEHTSELQSRIHLVCRLRLQKKNTERAVRRV